MRPWPSFFTANVSLNSARSSSNSRNSALLKCNFELDSWSCCSFKSGGVTSVTGSHCARGIHLSASGHDGHLLAFLAQCRGYAISFRRRGLRVMFYQAIFYSEVVLQYCHHYSLTHCRYYLVLGHYQTRRTGSRRGMIPLLTDACLAPYVHRCIIGAQFVQS
jgi:hypothetical protein